MDFEVETTGFDAAIQELKELERDLGQGGMFLEFGTTKLVA